MSPTATTALESTSPRRKTWKDPASALSHFLGFLAAIGGMAVLLVQSPAGTAKVVSFTIYGVSLCALFLASSSYHFFDLGERQNKLLRRLDHAAIFILIAGSNVPIQVHLLEGTWRTAMLGTVSGLAIAGVIFKLTWFSCPRWLDAAMYVGMGWMVVIAGPVMYPRMSSAHLGWLIAGGLLYTSGAVIYALKRPDPWPEVFGFHEIWHLFVLAGAGCHYGMTYSLLQTPYPPF